MLLRQLAIISQTRRVSFSELTRVAAALSKQVTRDFSPVWEINAMVDAFEKLEDVPIGYWPIIVKDNIRIPGAAGIHLDKNNQPYALVTAGPEWSLTASHEVLEMLADPFGNRLIAGDSPKPDQGRVEFLVEVSDPSEAAAFGYTVNSILVSDFYTPRYFDPVWAAGVQYSFTGAITEPRQVLQGGYLSWHDPVSDEWFQETWFDGDEPQFRSLGHFDAKQGSLRAQIDRLTNELSRKAMQSARPSDMRLATMSPGAATQMATLHGQASAARARALQVEIDAVANGGETDAVPLRRTASSSKKGSRAGGSQVETRRRPGGVGRKEEEPES